MKNVKIEFKFRSKVEEPEVLTFWEKVEERINNFIDSLFGFNFI